MPADITHITNCSWEPEVFGGPWTRDCQACKREFKPTDLYLTPDSLAYLGTTRYRLCGRCWVQRHKNSCGCGTWRAFAAAQALLSMEDDE